MQTSRTLTVGNDFSATLDRIDSSLMKKVYCSCGCIIDLDRSYFNRRMNLGKEIECIHCRNARISHEIDELNAHFNGEDVQQDGLFF